MSACINCMFGGGGGGGGGVGGGGMEREVGGDMIYKDTHLPVLIAMIMGPTWGPSGANRTQVGPMNLAIWGIGIPIIKTRWSHDHLIIIMGITTHGKMIFILKQDPVILSYTQHNLAHWGQDKMAVILQTTSSRAFFRKMFILWLLHWSLLSRFQLTIQWHKFRQWLGAC